MTHKTTKRKRNPWRKTLSEWVRILKDISYFHLVVLFALSRCVCVCVPAIVIIVIFLHLFRFLTPPPISIPIDILTFAHRQQYYDVRKSFAYHRCAKNGWHFQWTNDGRGDEMFQGVIHVCMHVLRTLVFVVLVCACVFSSRFLRYHALDMCVIFERKKRRKINFLIQRVCAHSVQWQN